MWIGRSNERRERKGERERENDIIQAVIGRLYIYSMLTNPKCLFTLIYSMIRNVGH